MGLSQPSKKNGLWPLLWRQQGGTVEFWTYRGDANESQSCRGGRPLGEPLILSSTLQINSCGKYRVSEKARQRGEYFNYCTSCPPRSMIIWVSRSFGHVGLFQSCQTLLVVSDSLWPRGLSPARLLHPWDFPVKNTGVYSNVWQNSLQINESWNVKKKNNK